MSRQRRQSYSGCSVESHEGRLRLRFRLALPDGKTRHIARATGLVDTPDNRGQLKPLTNMVAAVIRAGKDPREVLDKYLIRPEGEPIDVAALLPAGPTVCEYYKSWIADQLPVVRKAQARDYRRRVTGYVLPTLGDMMLADLKPSDVRGLQAELLSRGLSVKFVKNIISGSFRAMIQQAKVDDLVTRDIFAGLKWPKWNPPKPDPFTAGERSRVVEWFRRKAFGFHAGRATSGPRLRPHPPYHVFIHMLFWTGLRPSEAAGLQWGDVDLKRSRLHVRRSRHLYDYGDPKTRSARRTEELFPETVRLLAAIQPLNVTPTTPVFVNTLGEPIEPNSMLKPWYACQRALGIRVRGLYCTKDTFVTTALTAGVKIAWLETQTGVSYATLRRHYGEWMPIEGESELRRFESLDQSLFGGPDCPRHADAPGTISKKRSNSRNPGVRKGGFVTARLSGTSRSPGPADAFSDEPRRDAHLASPVR
jgi:integrase